MKRIVSWRGTLSIIIIIVCIVLSLVFFDNYGGALF